MSEKTLFVKQIKPGVYLLDEKHEATGYLVVGESKACVIDTMNGVCNLKEEVRKLTDKPLMVINTHGHPDHIYGNMYFDEAYINPLDLELAQQFIDDPEFVKICKDKDLQMPPFKDIKGGDVIDLGGKTLEVYDLPGHTAGEIVLLLKEDRILFTGDSINHHLWLQLGGCPPIPECIKAIDKVMFLENEADIILHGHAHDFDDISLMHCLRDGLIEIRDGKTSEDEPYVWFDGVGKAHHFKVEPNKHYQQEDHVICYNPVSMIRKQR